MTLTHPGSTGTVSSPSPHLGAFERGYPASLTALVAEQRTAELVRSATLTRSARQTLAASPRGATAVVRARGALAAVRVTLAQALTRRAPWGKGRHSSKGYTTVTRPTSLVCCA